MWKNKSKKLACFSKPFMRRQLTTFHHAFTTHLPSKNHTQTPTFPRTPLKKLSKATKKYSTGPPDFFWQTTAFSE
jgi:hypothetical protein